MPDFITVDEINGQVTNSESNIISNLSSIKIDLNTINSSLNTVNSTASRGAVKSVQRGVVNGTTEREYYDIDSKCNITISSINSSKSSVSLYTGIVSSSDLNTGSNRGVYAQAAGIGAYVESLTTTQLTIRRNYLYKSDSPSYYYYYPAFS